MIVTTNTKFRNDLMDVARLFYPASDGPDIEHEHGVQGGQFVERVGISGRESAIHTCPEATGTPIEVDRAVKRAAKIALYELLRGETSIRPPWGSLTGIRPTRLFQEAVQDGMTPELAERFMTLRYDVDEVRAKLLRDIHDMQAPLPRRQSNEYDLYIGIPFCTTRCAYCSFSSGEIGNGALVEPYLQALISEMRGAAELVRDHRPRAAYMGGGTPTSLTAGQLDRLLTEAAKLFPGAIEWTVEAGRPDTIDEPKLSVLSKHGIGRISINPQTWSDGTLRRIGRAHTALDTLDAYELARRMGFDHINMDLISALPGETMRDFEHTLKRTIELDPESVTVHTLAIKHGSRLNEAGYRQPDASEAQQMVDLARESLQRAGYRPYYLYRQKYMAGNLENVGYAKPGHACLYNIEIMEETAPILALGAGAITKWLFDRERRIERAPNVKNIEQYIQRTDEMVRRKRILITEERRP